MERPTNSQLLDRQGQPLSEPIQRVLRTLVPRFRQHYPVLDDLALTEVLEEAGQRLADRDVSRGPIASLRVYAWKTLRSVAVSRLRRSDMRVERATMGSEASDRVVTSLSSDLASADRIERDILLREVLAFVSPQERLICMLKAGGFSSRDIANRLGRSVTGVNVAFWRATRKMRTASVSWGRRASPLRDASPVDRPVVRGRPPLGDADD
jgi:DNA-directed RNA polymerase specialized sigma24 family protein